MGSLLPLATGLPTAMPSWGHVPLTRQWMEGESPSTVTEPRLRPVQSTLLGTTTSLLLPAPVQRAGDEVEAYGGAGEGRVSLEESALLDGHLGLLQGRGFFRSGSSWSTATGARVRTSDVFWFLKGHLAVFPEVHQVPQLRTCPTTQCSRPSPGRWMKGNTRTRRTFTSLEVRVSTGSERMSGNRR